MCGSLRRHFNRRGSPNTYTQDVCLCVWGIGSVVSSKPDGGSINVLYTQLVKFIYSGAGRQPALTTLGLNNHTFGSQSHSLDGFSSAAACLRAKPFCRGVCSIYISLVYMSLSLAFPSMLSIPKNFLTLISFPSAWLCECESYSIYDRCWVGLSNNMNSFD